MRLIYLVAPLMLVLVACVNNPVEPSFDSNDNSSLRLLLTKSVVQEDSLTMMSKQQSDMDNLMMGRVILKDSCYILSIKREDAIFLGVSEDVYDSYSEFVERLNETNQ